MPSVVILFDLVTFAPVTFVLFTSSLMTFLLATLPRITLSKEPLLKAKAQSGVHLLIKIGCFVKKKNIVSV